MHPSTTAYSRPEAGAVHQRKEGDCDPGLAGRGLGASIPGRPEEQCHAGRMSRQEARASCVVWGASCFMATMEVPQKKKGDTRRGREGVGAVRRGRSRRQRVSFAWCLERQQGERQQRVQGHYAGYAAASHGMPPGCRSCGPQ